MPPIMLLSQTLCIPTDFRLIPFLRRGRTTVPRPPTPVFLPTPLSGRNRL
jgi:hypothetical protein